MSIRDLVRWGDARLLSQNEEVVSSDAGLAALIVDLLDTCHAAPGVGLAAPQIGINRRVAVVDLSVGEDPSAIIVLVNPVILSTSGEQKEEEGCLSVPDVAEKVVSLPDVDDKTIRGAQEADLPLADFTAKYSDAFFRDIRRLNVQPAEGYPRATEHVPEMIDLIRRLDARGHTYESDGSVYFRISTFPGYGKLSGIDLDRTRRSERVADDEYEKEDVRDFAVWKAAKPGE